MGHTIVMVGDFSSHGLPAAVGIVPTAELFYELTGKGYALTYLVETLNQRLCQILPTELFLTASFIELEASAQIAQIWNGANPPEDGHGDAGACNSDGSDAGGWATPTRLCESAV